MMKLNHGCCPTCSSRLIAETRWGKHCNGHWNERQEFSCGFTHDFSPNFMRVEVSRECPKNPAEAQKRLKRTKVRDALEQMLSEADVDDDFKKRTRNYGWGAR